MAKMAIDSGGPGYIGPSMHPDGERVNVTVSVAKIDNYRRYLPQLLIASKVSVTRKGDKTNEF